MKQSSFVALFHSSRCAVRGTKQSDIILLSPRKSCSSVTIPGVCLLLIGRLLILTQVALSPPVSRDSVALACVAGALGRLGGSSFDGADEINAAAQKA